MKWGKVNESKIVLKNYCAIQFEHAKNLSTFKDFFWVCWKPSEKVASRT